MTDFRAHSRTLRSARGLTLMDLIVVIVIIGVLSGMMLPKLVDLRDEAHRNSAAATAGVFRSAVYLANLACIKDEFAGLDNLPIYGAGNLDFNANCFPSGTNGNNTFNMNPARCLEVWNGLMFPAPSISTVVTDDTDYHSAASGANCTYTYRRDTDTTRNFTYGADTGTVVVTNP